MFCIVHVVIIPGHCIQSMTQCVLWPGTRARQLGPGTRAKEMSFSPEEPAHCCCHLRSKLDKIH